MYINSASLILDLQDKSEVTHSQTHPYTGGGGYHARHHRLLRSDNHWYTLTHWWKTWPQQGQGFEPPTGGQSPPEPLPPIRAWMNLNHFEIFLPSQRRRLQGPGTVPAKFLLATESWVGFLSSCSGGPTTPLPRRGGTESNLVVWLKQMHNQQIYHRHSLAK